MFKIKVLKNPNLSVMTDRDLKRTFQIDKAFIEHQKSNKELHLLQKICKKYLKQDSNLHAVHELPLILEQSEIQTLTQTTCRNSEIGCDPIEMAPFEITTKISFIHHSPKTADEMMPSGLCTEFNSPVDQVKFKESKKQFPKKMDEFIKNHKNKMNLQSRGDVDPVSMISSAAISPVCSPKQSLKDFKLNLKHKE